MTGTRLVQFEPEENQALVDERFDASAMSAAVTFLLGKGDLLKEFVPALGDDGALRLTPRVPDPRVARVTLTVGADGEVTGTAVLDGSGNENRLDLRGPEAQPGARGRGLPGGAPGQRAPPRHAREVSLA